MANASQGVGYFSGTTQGSQSNIQYVGGTRVKLGNLEPRAGTPIRQTVLGSTVKLGRDDSTARLPVGFTTDRAPNVPSGYAANGKATYGSGKINKSLVFATDNSRGRNASFTWLTPGLPSKKAYNTLT